MRRRAVALTTTVMALLVVFLVGNRLMHAQGQAKMTEWSAAAFPGTKGGQDVFGGYDVQLNWPKPISDLPGNEKWTFGAGQGVFAESPNRVFVLERGELPNIQRPPAVKIAPSVTFPVGRAPWRDATGASLPGNGGSGALAEGGLTNFAGIVGEDALWQNCFLVVDANGNITDIWKQWDDILKRPHAVYISPYDPDKRVWVVDDHQHAIYIFTNDGKTLLQTIGTPGFHGADATHFNRPTFIAWLPDGTFFVADGYNGTRVAKFDKSGKFLLDWGQKGDAGGKETRPSYMNNVHGVAVDVQTRRVFVNDRGNHRAQVFDENGKYLDSWSFGDNPSDVHLFIIGADRYLWAFDRGTSKMLKYDLDGNFLYSWGVTGDFPGAFWGVHGMATDQDGNLYTAAVDTGGAQKFVPKKGARPEVLVGKPVKPVWQ